MDYQIYKELGILAVVIVPFFFLVKWIADEFRVTLCAHREERRIWGELYAAHQKAIVEHNERAKSFQEHVQLEHEKMISNLEKACLQHQEMILTLGRINGYKHE
jgi:hypothetical protein